MQTAINRAEAVTPRSQGETAVRRAGRSLLWLAYLGIYFLPWFDQRPSAIDVTAGALGVIVFLILYFHLFLGKPRSALPHVLAMAALGFVLAPFGGAWSVFNVYAAIFAGRMQPPGRALWLVGGLQVALVAYGLALHTSPFAWGAGVFFGLLACGGVMLQGDLERRNAQLLAAQEEVRVLAALAERERIARDLHDLLGHTLTLVAIKAELAARLIDRDAQGARREMDEVAASAREALSEVRAAVAGMRGASFAAELERARLMLAAADVAAEFGAAPAPVDPRREAVLAMALREAVTNVIRHAAARRCVVSLETGLRGDLRLVVADDGRGGAVEAGGLGGMRARLSAAGGALEIQSNGAGTRLVATLPRPAA